MSSIALGDFVHFLPNQIFENLNLTKIINVFANITYIYVIIFLMHHAIYHNK